MIEAINKRKKSVLVLLAVCILTAAAAFVTVALLRQGTTKLTNTFELGNVTTEIEEEFKQTDIATVFEKTPKVKNTGINDCYIRVRVEASPEDALNITGWDEQNWKYNQADGFYYYQNVVAPGEYTTVLFDKVAVKEEAIPTIEGFEVNVYQEAVQAQMNARDHSVTSNMAVIWSCYDAGIIPDSFQ